ncbi:MAG: type II secretion system F family protein [Pirellulales bacterium]
MSPTIIAILVFGAFCFGLAAILLVLQDMNVARQAATGQKIQLSQLPLDRRAPAPRTVIGRFDHWFYRLIIESGVSWAPVTAILAMIFLGALVGGIVLLSSEAPVAATIGVLIGMAVALVLLMHTRGRRIRQLQEQLPPALEMLARAVRAGESLDQAVQLAGKKSPEPLAVEFRRCANQLAMGLSMECVMKALVHRVRITDMKIFTTTLTIHRQTGGNLGWTLERLAGVIRERLTYRRQMRASTAAGRMSASLIASIGPLLFIYLFFAEPDYVRGLTVSPLGQSMLMMAIFLEVVGLVWIVRMLRTDY